MYYISVTICNLFLIFSKITAMFGILQSTILEIENYISQIKLLNSNNIIFCILDKSSDILVSVCDGY
jgi:hypothetical protein